MTWSHQLIASVVVGTLAAMLGVVVIVGWYSGNAALVQVVPGLPGMQFNTAFSFIAAGSALLAIAFRRYKFSWPGVVWLVLVGALTLAQYFFDVNLGIDQLLFKSELQIANPYPGRMGANTAFCFLLAGVSLALLALPLRFRWRLFVLVALASSILAVSASVLIGHAMSVSLRFGWGMFTQMALHTATGFVVLSAGLLCATRCEVTDVPAQHAVGARNVPSGSAAAWLVLIISLVLTLGAWYAMSVYLSQGARTRFELTMERMTTAIEHRLHDQEQILIGAQGLFAASREVERAEFRQYIEAQQLERRFPGMLGVGLKLRVSAARRAAHVGALRAEGFADYDIHPGASRVEHFPVVLLEPFNARNRRAFGYDGFSEPLRREAMERARDRGDVAVSGKVVLVQETGQDAQAGFLMFAPVYRGGRVPQAVAARRELLFGFVYSPFRTTDLFRTIPELGSSEVALRIYDNLNPDPRSLLFDADAELTDKERNYRSSLEDTRSLTIGDRHWMLRFHTRPRFDAAIPTYESVLVLFGGVLISLLLFGIVWSLSTTRARALALAEDMTHQLRDSAQRYRLLADESQGLICEHDLSGTLLYVNEAAARSLGYTPEEMVGRSLGEFLTSNVRERFTDYLARVASGRDQGTMSILAKSGEERVWKYDNVRYEIPGGGDRVLGHAQDVTEMVRAQRELQKAKQTAQEQAALDPLTGLSNRRMFDQYFARALEHARRRHEQLALLFLDLDGFKQVNDTCGHAVGDRLLRHVADALARSIRKSDLAARLGGDEFALVLGNVHARNDVQTVARKFTELLQAPLLVDGNEIVARFSLGVAMFPDDGDTAEQLLRHADAAMYGVKRERAASRG